VQTARAFRTGSAFFWVVEGSASALVVRSARMKDEESIIDQHDVRKYCN
jgi:hypothetical protein